MSNIIKSEYAARKDGSKRKISVRPLFAESNAALDSSLTHEHNRQAEALLERAYIQSEKLQEEAARYMKEAREQIAREREDWEREKQVLKEQEKQKGYAEGFQEAKQECRKEYEAFIQEAKSIVRASQESYYEYLAQSEEVIFELGFSLAEKIIDGKLQLDKGYFMSVVKKAIKEVRDQKEIQIFVSPSNYVFVNEHKDQLFALLNGEAVLFISPNEDLDDYKCIVESSYGRIDASIDEQLKELKIKLAEMLMGDGRLEGSAADT